LKQRKFGSASDQTARQPEVFCKERGEKKDSTKRESGGAAIIGTNRRTTGAAERSESARAYRRKSKVLRRN